jgi:hypothetical protein
VLDKNCDASRDGYRYYPATIEAKYTINTFGLTDRPLKLTHTETTEGHGREVVLLAGIPRSSRSGCVGLGVACLGEATPPLSADGCGSGTGVAGHRNGGLAPAPGRRNVVNRAHIYDLNYSQLSLMKRLLLSTALLLSVFTTQAQIRYVNNPRTAIESQPGMGYELPGYLQVGDSVLTLVQPSANPEYLSADTRSQFIYVSYPAYRSNEAGQGWVMNRCLESSRSALPIQRTYNFSEIKTKDVYVPVTEGSQPSVIGRRSYTTGPRGGCYYLSASGKKVYVDRSMCR